MISRILRTVVAALIAVAVASAKAEAPLESGGPEVVVPAQAPQRAGADANSQSGSQSGSQAGPAPRGGLRKWELGVGVGTLRLPHYRGSDQNDVYTLPIPYVIYRGDRVSVDRSGASGWLLRTERTEVDLTLALGNPVRSAHNHAREGMPDLHVALEIGPKLVVRLAGERRDSHRWTFQWPVRVAYGFGFPEVERIGWVTNPYLEYGARNVFGTAFGVGLQAGPVFADRDYHRYYYAVDPVYARPDRPAYEARAGYGGMQYTVTLFRRAGQWWMGGFVRAYDLRGAVFEDSPLVKRDYAIYAGLAVAYVFAESEARARRGE